MKSYEDGYKEGFCDGFKAGFREQCAQKSLEKLSAEDYNEQMRNAMEWSRRMSEEMNKWHPPFVITCVDQH